MRAYNTVARRAPRRKRPKLSPARLADPIFLRVRGVLNAEKNSPRPSRRVASPPCPAHARESHVDSGPIRPCSDAERGEPPVPWPTAVSTFRTAKCVCGVAAPGCYQSLFAWNATDAGTEDFHPAAQVCGLTVVVPNLLGSSPPPCPPWPRSSPSPRRTSSYSRGTDDAQAEDAKAAQHQRNRLRPVLVLLVPVQGDDEKIEDFCLYLAARRARRARRRGT